jgi:molybdenum cofactor cytidylyltransferase
MTGADAPLSPLIGIVVLAAGGSTRLGRPKQLIPYRGATLLRHAAQIALEAALGPVLVVLGANAESCGQELHGLDVRTLIHAGWRDGMGSTIRAAAEALAADHAIGALILTACDQPQVSPMDLRRLAEEYRHTGATAVGSAYAGTVGIPALFDRSRFAVLETLSGDQGAKAIMRSEGDRLATIPCPSAALDVDAEADTINLE